MGYSLNVKDLFSAKTVPPPLKLLNPYN